MDVISLQLDYVTSADLVAQTDNWWSDVLGVVGFEKPPLVKPLRVPVTASMTPPLAAAGQVCEVWRVSGGHTSLRVGPSGPTPPGLGRMQYRHCDELLFGSITLDETATEQVGAAALRLATATAYRQIFAVLQQTQHRHLIRVWNYLPEINRQADGEERYRHFNSARRAAFHESGRSIVGTVPAASALGSAAGSPISIYFLASQHAPRMIENPRQTSAYHYPSKFGLHSPIFSRACLLEQCSGTNLFVSGTASIVGYETLHAGDVKAQTYETLTNIDALLDQANRFMGSSRYSLNELRFKVYVRQPADLDEVEAALSSALRPNAAIVFLKADVCREDLLVEIEATGDIAHTLRKA